MHHTRSASEQIQTPSSWLSRPATHSYKFTAPRLGLGATIVRTPDDALRDTGIRINYHSEKSLKNKLRANTKRPPPLSTPTSPPLPPLPLPEKDEQIFLQDESVIPAPRPPRSAPPPPAPDRPDLQRTPSLSRRSSLKLPKAISFTHSSSSSEEPPSVPPLPSHVAASTQPPPFSPVLIIEPSWPPSPLNVERVIITLETCTQTFRTTLSTLTSRHSHLANFLSAIYPSNSLRTPNPNPNPNPIPIAPVLSASSSQYSTQSDDPGVVYRNFFSSRSAAPPASILHIFLDRPSAPYPHILSYLRQPIVDSQPESLPYALQLHNYTSSIIQTSSPSLLQSKLDTLIEVRDEAAYLNLEGLHKLCAEEIKNRYNSKQLTVQIQGHGQGYHMRGLSSSSMQSLHSVQASICNLHPLRESTEAESSETILNSSSTSSTSQPTPSPLLSSSVFNNPTREPAAPSPAAIAVRRRSKQILAPPSSESIVSKTPPGGQDPQQQLSQSQSNRSRSNSRSRPAAPPVGWI